MSINRSRRGFMAGIASLVGLSAAVGAAVSPVKAHPPLPVRTGGKWYTRKNAHERRRFSSRDANSWRCTAYCDGVELPQCKFVDLKRQFAIVYVAPFDGSTRVVHGDIAVFVANSDADFCMNWPESKSADLRADLDEACRMLSSGEIGEGTL